LLEDLSEMICVCRFHLQAAFDLALLKFEVKLFVDSVECDVCSSDS